MITNQIGLGARGDRAFAGGAGHGWFLLLPGVPQWRRGERSRGLVILGWYWSAVMVAGFGWGSMIGAMLLGAAFLAHCASVADEVRQSAFPGFGSWAPWFSAAVGLGVVGYVPGLLVALTLAYPAWTKDGGYLVNRRAYEQQAPAPGQWVWLDRQTSASSIDRPKGMARVVAVAGQVVSWSNGGILIDGRKPVVDSEGLLLTPRTQGRFEVPERALLVVCEGPRSRQGSWQQEILSSSRLELVPTDWVIGRPWACSYPIWKRRLIG
ncbi:S26 family signal peptidase [Tautonia rosea]|uniref:hypothetical protein n=1 Tax=Tautonia rosea TaxID=2728037 RepID=UPI001475985A|nr:hypothetical protein [Tautonia rosea]